MTNQIKTLQEQVLNAIEDSSPLKIVGGNSKAFLGRISVGTPIEISTYYGIINYEPTELYITAKAGTLLSEINSTLSERGQMLAFEPAQINSHTTIGGVVAAGMSGPRRAYTGAVRDFVLGVKCLNGLGKELTFGGQVMKNVAGYDLSRLMTGAFGTLGIILEVSLKVMPLPEIEETYYSVMSVDDTLTKMRALSAQAIPISASYYDGEAIYIRLSGNESAVAETAKTIGLDKYEQGNELWHELRDYKSAIFHSDKNIWRLSVPNTARLDLGDDPYVIEWGGGQYWLNSDRPAQDIFNLAKEAGGSAMLFHRAEAENTEEFLQAIDDDLLALHKELKQSFDPHNILNPGKMYSTI